MPIEPLDSIITEESLKFIVLFNDESVQIMPFEQLMAIVPWLRRQCTNVLMDK